MAEQRLVTHALGGIGVVVGSAAGMKSPKHKDFDPVQAIAQRKEAIEFCGKRTARLLLDLNRDRKIPPWVRSELQDSWDLIRMRANG
jgi:hypothetical protein